MASHLIVKLLVVMKSGIANQRIDTQQYNHPGDMPEGTLRAILRQAGIDPDDFLNG
jgi:ABC-type nitrate/sulfonate/bicarbonate transport system substrate-binding protein